MVETEKLCNTLIIFQQILLVKGVLGAVFSILVSARLGNEWYRLIVYRKLCYQGIMNDNEVGALAVTAPIQHVHQLKNILKTLA